MEYTQLETCMAGALLRSKISQRAQVPAAEQAKLSRLSPGKQYALEWRIEAAYQAQEGRQLVSKAMINRLSNRLPDDKDGMAEGIVFHAFEDAIRKTRRKETDRVRIDILAILWHLPVHLVHVLAAQILANPTFNTLDLDAWLDKYGVERDQSLPSPKGMKAAPAKK